MASVTLLSSYLVGVFVMNLPGCNDLHLVGEAISSKKFGRLKFISVMLIRRILKYISGNPKYVLLLKVKW